MNCPKCAKTAIKSGLFGSEYLDLVNGRPVRRAAFRQRYACRMCSITWSERPAKMHATRNMTLRAESWIRKQSETRSNVDIARECGVDESTIRKILYS